MAEAFGVAAMLYLMLLFVWAVVVGAVLFIMRALPGPRWRHPDPAVRRAAIDTLRDGAVLAHVARTDEDAGLRQTAQARLESLGDSR
jgi:hypothetical protein